MTTPHIHQYPAHGGGATAETFSPSDRKVIRLDDWRRDRLQRRPAPTLMIPGWMIMRSANDPTPPTPAAPALPPPLAA